MSTIRDPATITSVGRRMVTAGGDITYTKAVLYGQDISHLTKDQLEGLTSIGSPLVTVPLGISDKSDNGNGTTVILEATFQNSNLKADLPYTAVGFFAKRGDETEKLVAVGVATDGAYLAATSPDGVATDALDIKVAIAIGDSANVTAMIDPAGSVTPAVLHDTATKIRSEMKSGLDTKANTADVNKSLDLKADKQTVIDDLAKKADQDDVAAKLATKADKTDVDAQIGTVNKSVSDLSDTVKANKDDTDKVLATKADKATVESELSTRANQSDLDATNAKVAKKADSEDVNAQLATKANSKDVNDALALKDDTADVDDKISNVTKSVSDLSATVTANKKATDSTLATKANASDVADSLATKADKTDVASDVKSLNDAINTKASQADLDKTNAVVATKANATALADYARTVDVDADLDTKANKTDLESLAKTADVNSALDTKADKATVNSDIKTINDTMDTKADKTTVDGDVKTLQASIDTKADKTALADYAKSADVASDVKTLTDSIATKADAQTVSDAISKIDLTPFAKTADVNSALSGKADKATIDAINKALASKRDITDSYSRDELDKKFLQLSADTGGKVSADQVSKLIAGKADQDDVDKKIKAVTDAVNTKANSSDVTSLINSNTDKLTQAINAITYNAKERPLPSNDANEITEDGIYRVGGDPLKNGAGQQWSFLLVKKWDENTIFQMIYGGTKGIFIRNISKTGNSYPAWTRVNVDADALQNTLNAKANSSDVNTALAKKDDITDVDAKIKTVTDLANTKADASDTYNKKAVDDAFSQRDSNLTTLQNNLQGQIDKQVNSTWAIDNNSGKFNAVIINASGNSTQSFTQPGLDLLNSQVDKINQLKGNRVVDAVDFNTLTDTGVYYVTNSNSSNKNAPVPQWGTLVVSNGNDHRLSQVYFPDDNNAPWYRTKDEGNWLGWQQLSTKSDVNNAVNSANSASARIDTVLGNSYFRKQGMNENGDLIEIRGNATKQTNGGYAFDIWSSDRTASKLKDVLGQLPSKANSSDVSALQNKVNISSNLFRQIQNSNNWKDIFGVDNPNNVLTSLRINPGGSGPLINDFAAGIGFGGDDTKGVLSVDYGSHQARITGGNGTGPSWSEDIAWKSDIDRLQGIINQQNQTIQSLTSRLTNAENEIRYIKANYVEGRTFPASQEAQANSWENENPQRIAFITK